MKHFEHLLTEHQNVCVCEYYYLCSSFQVQGEVKSMYVNFYIFTADLHFFFQILAEEYKHSSLI